MEDIFISYSRSAEDELLARELEQDLRRAGINVWFDGSRLHAGENWAFEIGKALEDADFMVLLLSPDAVNSRWVANELEYALTHEKFERTLVPVIVRPVDRGKFPWILEAMKHIQWLDATRNRAGAVKQLIKLVQGRAKKVAQ